MTFFGHEWIWTGENDIQKFGIDLLRGIEYLILIVFFYFLLLRAFKLVTQKSDTEGVETSYMITKIIQVTIAKDILFLLYYLVNLLFHQINPVEAEQYTNISAVSIYMDMAAFIFSVLILAPLVRKRIEVNYDDYNKLLVSSTFICLLVYAIVYTINYTVISILVELPLGLW